MPSAHKPPPRKPRISLKEAQCVVFRHLAKMRREKISPEKRREIAMNAINARWDAHYKAHPEKLAQKLAEKAGVDERRAKRNARRAAASTEKPEEAI